MICRYCGNKDSKEDICEYCMIHIESENVAATSTTNEVHVTLLGELKEIAIEVMKDPIKAGVKNYYKLSTKFMSIIIAISVVISIIYCSINSSAKSILLKGVLSTIIPLIIAFFILYAFTKTDRRKEVSVLSLFKAIMTAYIPVLCIFVIRVLMTAIYVELGAIITVMAKVLFSIVLYNILINERLVSGNKAILATLSITLVI